MGAKMGAPYYLPFIRQSNHHPYSLSSLIFYESHLPTSHHEQFQLTDGDVIKSNNLAKY